MTSEQETRSGADLGRPDAKAPGGGATDAGEPDAGVPAPGAEDTGWSLRENRVARIGGIALFALIIAVATATGAVGWLFSLLVFAPVLVAMGCSEAGLADGSRWARVAAVVGLILWLALTGGLPMLLVVGAVVLMIFLHELGHYMAARWSGMKVTEFFLGFGTKIWSFKRGETDFGLKVIPAGAYVKIIGMNNLEEVDEADEPRTYRQAPFKNRMAVAVAGSGMHFAIALVLLVVQFAFIGRADDTRWLVGELTSGGAAEQAGLEEGDRIVSFAGDPVGDFGDFRDQIRSEAGTVAVVVERDGANETIPVDLIRRTKVIGTVGTDVDILEGPGGLSIGPLGANSRGERAGLETGQVLTEVNGVAVSDVDDVIAAVSSAGSAEGGEVSFTVADGPAVGTTIVTVDLGSEVGATESTTFLGVAAQPELRTESIPSALGSSVTEFGRGVGASVSGIVTVFNPPELFGFFSDTVTGEDKDVTDEPTPAEQVEISTDAGRPTSIIGAVAYGADLTGENLSNLIGFLIGLNIFIGVFNLIPLLPFDGGHVSIAVYEKAQELRRRTKSRYIADVTRMIPVAYTVVMLLAVVGLLAIYLDLTKGVSA
ncbi:MAG: site-2 protease family protein [Microthrixaceae bacterium]